MFNLNFLNRNRFAFKFIFLAFAGIIFLTKSHAQFTATWTLLTNKTAAITGAQAGNAVAGDMVPGANFVANGAHNTDGFKCQQSIGNWPTAPTDDYHLDFPLRPNTGFDLNITGLTLTARTSGSSGSNLISLAYQVDGAGPWIAFGSVQTAPSGGSTNLNFGALTQTFFNNHTYVIRLYIYASGTISNSRQVFIRNVAFTGNAVVAGIAPGVVTNSASATGKYSGTAQGTITAGTIPVTASGIVWATTANPTLANNVVSTPAPVSAGSYNLNITGLTAGTLYHVRAYVTTAAGTSYGADLSFTTDQPTIPALTTRAATAILARSASSGGIFTDSGGVAVTAKGIVFNTTGTPTYPANNPTSDGANATDYFSALSTLLPSTTYFVRAYAINSKGVGYGNQIQFTTAVQTTELYVSPATLDFGDVTINTFSTKTFTVSGYVLSPAAGNITVAAPAGYQVSLSAASGFANSINVPYTGATLNPTTIHVRFAPITFGPVSGNITVSGGTATPKTVALTGRGVQNPGDFSNKGTDFWVGYATHNLMYSNATTMQTNGGDQSMELYFTSDIDAVVTVTIPGLGLTLASNLPVPANTVQSVVIPKSPGSTLPPNVAQLYREGLFNSAIHIVSDNAVPIVAYAHIYGSLVSGATLLLPTNTWSTEYYAISAQQNTSSGSSTGSYNYFFVIPKDDNTTIEITPTVNTIGGTGLNELPMQAFQTYTKTLNKGQIYNILAVKGGGEDVSGSLIRSTDCTKKIAVFSGSGRVGINSPCSTSPSSDNLFAQVMPRVAWGTKYLTTRTNGTILENMYRVCVKDPTTIITVNGQPLTTKYPSAVLTNNFFYEFRDSFALKIESNKPVMVAQYVESTQGCTTGGANANGDPEMIILSPVQQAIKNVTLYSPANQQISFPYVDVIIPNSGASSFTLNGVNKASGFVAHPQDAGFSYASFTLADGVTLNGAATIASSVGFTAIAYGFADATQGGSNPRRESYGYNAGTQLNDLTTPIILNNPYGDPVSSATGTPTTCRGTTFRVAATLPYQTNRITFGFLGNTHITPNTDTTLLATSGNLTADSTFVVNGITYYVYRLATDYTFDAVGDYTIRITSFNPTADAGCASGSDKTVNYTIKVVDGVVPNFNITYNNCLNDSVKLFDVSNGLGYNITQWRWTYNNNTIQLPAPFYTQQNVAIRNPANNTANNFTVRAINSIGCFSQLTKALPINPTATVTFGQLAGVCTTAQPFALTGASATGATGTGVYSGPGVTSSTGIFNPATAGAGTHTITYTFTTTAGCVSSATSTIVVTAAFNLVITPIPVQCNGGQPVTLVANQAGGTFSGTGVSGNTFNPGNLAPGNYTVTYSIPGNTCTVPATLQVVVGANPTVNAGADQSIIFGNTVTLTGVASAGTYLWTPSAGLSAATALVTTVVPQVTTTYTLTATSASGCKASDDVIITVIPVCTDPANVFTPNGDGLYDTWIVYKGACAKKVLTNVYNRWGALVYHSDNYNNDWKGTYQNKNLPDGTYYYMLQITLIDNSVINLKGNVTIMR